MGKTEVSFTLHALDVMEEREIVREWVERVIAQPSLRFRDPADPELTAVLAPIPERENRVLRVIYNAEVDPTRVVTTFFDRGMRGRL
jgi:hypothetical protein